VIFYNKLIKINFLKETTSRRENMDSMPNRIITIEDKKTSVSLVPTEWNILDAICEVENVKRKELIDAIFAKKVDQDSLTSSVRIFLLSYLRKSVQWHYTPGKGRNKFSMVREILESM
jgi:predicted DNA-binding ribbon-helix-helix protein